MKANISQLEVKERIAQAEQNIEDLPIGSEINFDIDKGLILTGEHPHLYSPAVEIVNKQIEDNADAFDAMDEICECGHKRFQHADCTDDCDFRGIYCECLAFTKEQSRTRIFTHTTLPGREDHGWYAGQRTITAKGSSVFGVYGTTKDEALENLDKEIARRKLTEYLTKIEGHSAEGAAKILAGANPVDVEAA